MMNTFQKSIYEVKEILKLFSLEINNFVMCLPCASSVTMAHLNTAV